MLLILTAIAAVCLLLAICFGVGEVLFGWPHATCRPLPGDARGAEPDPTGCGYAYQAIGVGLAAAIAITIGVGLLTGSVAQGMLAAAAVGGLGVCLRGWRMWKDRPAGLGVSNEAAACDAPAALAPVNASAVGRWDFFGPVRPATRRDHVKLLALVGVTLVFFLGAEFRSDHLFDPDGNDHAVCVRWLLDQDNLVEPYPAHPVLHYIDAYPPGFDLTAAALGHMCGDRAGFPLRILNALLIALSVGWLHGMVLELTRRPRLAFWAAFFFVMAPNNLTHFIWSHTLAVGWLPLLTLLGCRVIRRSRSALAEVPAAPAAKPAGPGRDILATGLILGGICLVSPVPGIKAILWATLPAVVALAQRNWRGVLNTLLAGCLAGLVALIWWGPMFAKYGSYQALWRAQLAPAIVARADTENWQAPAATDVVGTGDVGINIRINFWGWDHAGMGSETSASALSLGWSQTILTLLGVGAALGAVVWRARAAPSSAGPGASSDSGGPAGGLESSALPCLRGADAVMGLLLIFTAFGFTGPLHGIEFYSYRFVLLMAIPTAYFQARGLAALLGYARPLHGAALGLTAVAWFTALFGYGLFPSHFAGVGDLLGLLLLLSWPVLGFMGARPVPPEPGVSAVTAVASRLRVSTAVALILFSLFAGGLNRAYLNYGPPVPIAYLENIGRTSEVALVDSLGAYLPIGTSVYMAGGMDCHRFVIAQEMRAPIFANLDDAALNRALVNDPASFAKSLRTAGVEAVVIGPSYQYRLPRQPSDTTQELQRRILEIEETLARQPGVAVIARLPSPNPSMAPAILLRLVPER